MEGKKEMDMTLLIITDVCDIWRSKLLSDRSYAKSYADQIK